MSKQVISAKNGRKTTFLIERDCLLRDFLRNRFSGRRIHFLRQGGCMYADGEEVTVNARLKAGQELVLVFTENEEFDYAPKDLGVKIIYEDDDVAVAYKPSGVASMPVAPYYDENLLNGLAFLRSGITFRVVTRLDKFTSGLVLLAKNALAHSVLNENHGKTEKFYTAVAEGNVPAPLEIIAPIKSGEGKKRFAGEGGKPAKTLVTAAEQCAFLNGCSLLKIKTFTGRTQDKGASCLCRSPARVRRFVRKRSLKFPNKRLFHGKQGRFEAARYRPFAQLFGHKIRSPRNGRNYVFRGGRGERFIRKAVFVCSRKRPIAKTNNRKEAE